jgi:hypothetical protein
LRATAGGRPDPAAAFAQRRRRGSVEQYRFYMPRNGYLSCRNRDKLILPARRHRVNNPDQFQTNCYKERAHKRPADREGNGYEKHQPPRGD